MVLKISGEKLFPIKVHIQFKIVLRGRFEIISVPVLLPYNLYINLWRENFVTFFTWLSSEMEVWHQNTLHFHFTYLNKQDKWFVISKMSEFKNYVSQLINYYRTFWKNLHRPNLSWNCSPEKKILKLNTENYFFNWTKSKHEIVRKLQIN